MAGAIRWRYWVEEELQQVRVTCNEQDVLEMAAEGTESQCVSTVCFLLHCIVFPAPNI